MAKRRIEVLVSSALLVFVHGACSFAPKLGDGSGGGPGAGAGGSTPGSGTGTGASSGSGTGGSGPALTDGGGFLPPPPPSVDANCGQVNNPLKVVPPDVLLIQDRSGSMDNDDNDQSCRRGCGAASKWSEMTVAVTQVVTTTQATVNWGLKFFADGSDPEACNVLPGATVPVLANNAGAITTALARRGTATNTPTRAAVQAGTAYLMSLQDTNPKYILLATDGEPNCAAGCTGNDCGVTPNPAEEMGSEKAVADAVAAGIKVFVVGIGNVASAVAVLNQMAINGGEAQTGAATSYYAATDQAALQTALNQIVGKVASCTLPLPGKPQDPTNVIVEDEATKTQIPRDTTHAEGWDYTDASDTAIQLYGTACSNVTNGTFSNVQILEGCPGTPIQIGFERPAR
ncbi:MAG: vWA domain-containing protein [Polyangia bacterium]